MTAEQLRGYREWKRTVPSQLRFLVEGAMLEKNIRLDQNDLPSVAEFYRGMKELLADPSRDSSTLDVSPVVQKQLAALTRIQVGEEGEEILNLFAAFASKAIDFDVKKNYVETQLLPRLEFLEGRDRRMVSQAVEQAGPTGVTGEEEGEEYTPHRAPTQESEGMPEHAIATVEPFFGGYYTDAVFDQFDAVTLTWKKSSRRLQELPEQKLERERARRYRSVVKNGKGIVKLPRGWGVDCARVKWLGEEPASWKFLHDQDGVVSVQTDQKEAVTFDVDIAPSQNAADLAPPESEVHAVMESFPQELLHFAQKLKGERVPHAAKVRRLASFIRSHLEYDMDPQWDAVYKAEPSSYFEKIWEYKKAKCDEANTLLVRLLTKMGVYAKFIGGHSVRAKSLSGEAMLLEGNRHAWSMAWDPDVKKWIRLDATPAGDPNVDQEEQEADLGEGDYGEQEAELMSQEELEKKLAQMEHDSREQKERLTPEGAYAKEAGCSLEVARDVLKKIADLRRKYEQVLDDAGRQWHKLVRAQMKERIVDRGPVAMSKMDEIDPDELVSGYIEVMAGEKDPLLGEMEEKELKQEKWFGGYEVYIAADMSGSMDETINGVKKADAQRDMVFLLVDSCMSAAVSVRQKERQLKAPMPVKVGVAVFGQKTEIVLPTTDEWTPAQQVKLYRALDAGAGGGTPDHDALGQLRQEIAQSAKAEEEARAKKPALKKHGWGMRRFVIATADGGSDHPSAVKAANDALKGDGIPVDLFLIAPEGDEHLKIAAEAAYQSVTPVSDVSDLAKKGLERLTQRIKEAYPV